MRFNLLFSYVAVASPVSVRLRSPSNKAFKAI